eukprot:TRINITY_DN20717_c0_g2_i1.p1 TRINITY_DN20717_c0_g2~~TRINITY_DN20717_c0_g2_i1.p1  ORF type:complete len:145 (+),score=36.86 TRINITY_DN20717_c0_g2_i1:64-435(+)
MCIRDRLSTLQALLGRLDLLLRPLRHTGCGGFVSVASEHSGKDGASADIQLFKEEVVRGLSLIEHEALPPETELVHTANARLVAWALAVTAGYRVCHAQEVLQLISQSAHLSLIHISEPTRPY